MFELDEWNGGSDAINVRLPEISDKFLTQYLQQETQLSQQFVKQYIVGYSALQKLLSVRYQNTFEVINQILEQADWTLTNAPEVLELVQYYETDGIKIANRVYETAVSALKNTYD